MEKMVINGETWVKESTGGDIKIVVLDKGWVYVGEFDDSDPDFVVIRSARHFIRWGTSMGLTELISGPTSETKLSAVAPLVKAPADKLLFVIDVDQKKWQQ